MAWDSTLIPMVRNLIGDVAATSYTDARIKTLCIVSAKLLLTEATFDDTYSVDVVNETISPDTSSPLDNGFINLLALKTAWVITNSEARTYSLLGVKVVDGPSSIDFVAGSKAIIERAKDLYNQYEKAKIEHLMHKVGGKAVTTPTTTQAYGTTSVFNHF